MKSIPIGGFMFLGHLQHAATEFDRAHRPPPHLKPKEANMSLELVSTNVSYAYFYLLPSRCISAQRVKQECPVQQSLEPLLSFFFFSLAPLACAKSQLRLLAA